MSGCLLARIEPAARPRPNTYAYPGTSNRVETVTRDAQTVRLFAYDAAGNIVSDARSGSTYAYTYNAAGRLKTVSYEGNLKGTYTYNGLEQLITRVITNSGTLDGTLHTVHDRSGNVIAEVDASGATVREYIWLPQGGYADTDLPLAVVDGVETASPVLYPVHADHLGRPIRMTDALKATVWQATWQPWGAPVSITGSLVLDARFPGQWFQLESGLHYNWHRHYDPSLGRYTQADPLGFLDGPSVFAYAGGNPLEFVDPEGRAAQFIIPIIIQYCRVNPAACAAAAAATGEAIKNICLMAAEHTKGKRPSTKEKHEAGEDRKGKDQGGEKADDRRYDMKEGERRNPPGPPSSPPKDSPEYLRPGPKLKR